MLAGHDVGLVLLSKVLHASSPVLSLQVVQVLQSLQRNPCVSSILMQVTQVGIRWTASSFVGGLLLTWGIKHMLQHTSRAIVGLESVT